MKWLKVSLPVAVCCLTASAFAQNQNFDQGQQQQNQLGGQGQAGSNMTDQQIAAWLLQGNREEINLSKLAEQHAKSQHVRDMAKEMVQQHSQAADQLKRFAGASADMAGMQRPGGQQNVGQQAAGQQAAGQQAAGQQIAGQQNPAQQQFAGQQPQNQTLTSSISGQPAANDMGQGLNFAAVLQQIGQQCEQSLSRELGEKQGAEFDKGFVGSQIGGHMHMLAEITVLKQYASPQLQPVLAQAEQTTRHHLEQLKQLMKTLESDKS